MKTIPLLFLATVAGAIIFTSCKPQRDEPYVKPQYSTPAKYDSISANYSDQTTVVLLLDSLSKLINKGKTQKVTKSQLLNVFENSSNLFTTKSSNVPSLRKQLMDLDQKFLISDVEAWFDSVETYSPMTGTLSTKNYFITPSGNDVAQLVQKTLMGAIYYNRIVSDEMILVKTKTTKEEMLVEWDEAFGYYGAPIDFNIYTEADFKKKYRDNNNDGKQNIPQEKYFLLANYSFTLDDKLKAFSSDNLNFRTILMNAFLNGRTAIENSDNAARDAAANTIRETLEKQMAASVLSYINATKRNIPKLDTPDNNDGKAHEWAEGRGFLNALNYKLDNKISSLQWNELNALYGNKVSDANIDKLNTAAKILQTVYGFTDIQRDNF